MFQHDMQKVHQEKKTSVWFEKIMRFWKDLCSVPLYNLPRASQQLETPMPISVGLSMIHSPPQPRAFPHGYTANLMLFCEGIEAGNLLCYT